MTDRTIAHEFSGNWHKVVGALIGPHGDRRLAIADFSRIDGMAVIVSHEDDGHTLRLRVLPQAEADRIAAAYQAAHGRKD